MWKPSSADQPGWDSPWGRGRPGWHLECSCMIEKHLGETIDIHAGGVDLVFPHHENEVAQSECAHGKTFVKYWMHNGYLVFGGGKMSKSEGNIQTIDGLLKKFPGEALRLMLLTAHYRQPLEFADEICAEQKRRLDRWYRLMDGVKAASEVPEAVMAALEDDLNTPKALAELEKLAAPETAAELKAGANFLGLLQESADAWFRGGDEGEGPGDGEIEALIAERLAARANKDFATSDRIRDELKEQGILLEDGAGGTTWRRAD
jgi:cysteinyl-tRNA synthetase